MTTPPNRTSRAGQRYPARKVRAAKMAATCCVRRGRAITAVTSLLAATFALPLMAACGISDTVSHASKESTKSQSDTLGESSAASTHVGQSTPSASSTRTSVTTSAAASQTKLATPSLGTRDEVKKFYDGLGLDIDWNYTPTPRGRPRYLGVVSGTYATIEIFGPADHVDEVDYQAVFDGTSQDANFDRALPMIRMAQKYVSEKAAMFVGAQLDYFTTLNAIPDRVRTQRAGDKYTRVHSIDVVNTVDTDISIGHRPST
jgi:hypothetical protein